MLMGDTGFAASPFNFALTAGKMWKKTFFASFTAQVLTTLGFGFAMPFLPFFIAELGIRDIGQQAFWSGIILGAHGVTLCIFAPLWGILADRYGRKLMVCRSMFGGAFILLLMSMVRTVGQLLACRLLQGVFTGTVSASVALVASVTPQERSGLTLGMMQAAVFIGTTIGPFFGGVVADMFGYRAAFRVGALITFLGGLLVLKMVRENFSPPDRNKCEQPPRFRDILAVKGFLVAVLIMFIVRLSNTMMNPSFPLILREIIPSAPNLNSVTGSVIASAAVAGALSAGLLGHIGDRSNHKKVLVFCCITAAVASAGHFFAFSLRYLFAVRILFGFSVAGMFPAANAMIHRTIDKKCMGRAYGAASSLSMSGLALGPFIGGTVARATNLRIPFLVLAGVQVLLAFIVFRYVKADNSMPAA